MVIKAIAGNVIREAVRQKIVYITLLFTLLLFAIEPALPSFGVGVRVQLFEDIALGISYLTIAVLAVALSVNQLPAEIEKRTIYNVLSKPVSKSAFLLGKYIGAITVLSICTALMGLAVFSFTYGYFGVISWGIFQGALTSFFEGALIAAFAILLSTFASPAISIFGCILLYFIGHAKNEVLAPILHNDGAARFIGLILTYMLPSLENFNINEAVARSVIISPSFTMKLSLYAIMFIVAFMASARMILAKKEL